MGEAVCWPGCSMDNRGIDKSHRPNKIKEKVEIIFKQLQYLYLTDRQNIKTCAVKCSYEEPLWPKGLNDDCMPGSENDICMVF